MAEDDNQYNIDVSRYVGSEDAERQRTVEASINRLRKRARQISDGAVRGAVLGILDLLGDEL